MAGRHGPGDGFEPEPAERLDLATDFVQLRNAIRVEVQLLDTREILGTGVLAMRWSEGLPNRSPNVVLLFGVRRLRNRLPGTVVGGYLRDGVAARAIFGIAKTWMIRNEMNDPHFDVIR